MLTTLSIKSRFRSMIAMNDDDDEITGNGDFDDNAR